METFLQTLNIIIIIGNVIAFLIIRNYLPSYLSKKAENLATKEDIAEITKKVEEVKIEFASQAHTLIKKRETYEKITNGLRVFIQGHPADQQEKTQMLEAYSISWLWANDDVLKKLNIHLDLQLKKTAKPSSVTQDELKQSYAECILEMRKNSGYNETKLTWQDFHFINF